MPILLRDGKRFLYLRNSANRELMGVFVGSLDLAPEQQTLDKIVETRFGAGYFAPENGPSWLLFIDNGNLVSQQLDESRPGLIGSPVLEAEGIGGAGSYAFFSVSSAGALAYRAGTAGGPNDVEMTWFSRSGQRQDRLLDRSAITSMSLSPDGTRAASALTRAGLAADIWMTDLTRGITTRVTSDPSIDIFPFWSPDSSRILFMSRRNAVGGLYEKRVDSVEPEQLILENRGAIIPNDWSPDGRFVLVSDSPKVNTFDLSLVQLQPTATKTPILNSPFNEGFAAFSPDGRFFAYVSDESGRDEVYVSTFTPPGAAAVTGAGKWRVSSDGGQRPRWRSDGKELFYRNEAKVMSVPIDTARSTFSPGKPIELFSVKGSLVVQWGVTADGQRFLMPMLPLGEASEPIRVTLNWTPGGQPAQ
jgi:dipeptidyl aminopeptidase/acylaminoacyl peptidase